MLNIKTQTKAEQEKRKKKPKPKTVAGRIKHDFFKTRFCTVAVNLNVKRMYS